MAELSLQPTPKIQDLRLEMSDATDCKVGFDSTLTSKFMCGEVGAEEDYLYDWPHPNNDGFKNVQWRGQHF